MFVIIQAYSHHPKDPCHRTADQHYLLFIRHSHHTVCTSRIPAQRRLSLLVLTHGHHTSHASPLAWPAVYIIPSSHPCTSFLHPTTTLPLLYYLWPIKPSSLPLLLITTSLLLRSTTTSLLTSYLPSGAHSTHHSGKSARVQLP